jgi:O-antigen/teichoic acid export membrane protein
VPLSKIISIQIAHHAGWNQSKAAVVGHMLPVFIVGLFLTILLIKRGKSGYIRKYWVFGLKFNIPLIPYYLSLKILDQSDRIMIDKYVGSDAAGIYSLAYSAASMLVILNSAINAGYIPWQFKAMTAKRNKDVVKTTNAILIVIGVANLLLMSAAPELLSILAPKSYYEALYVIPPIAISCFFRYLGQIFINIEFYYEKSRYTSLASVCSAVLNVGLNALFIPHFGYLAAGYTTLLCYIVNMGFHYYMAMRLTKKNGEIFYFRLETILLQSVAAVGFSLIFILTYENVLIRYSILIALVVVIIWNRKRLGEILRHFSIGKQ